MRRSTVLLLVLLSGWFAHAADLVQRPNQLVVWLIPSEPATPDAGIGATTDCENDTNQTGTLPQRIEEEIGRFNAEMAQTRVTVINTQDRFKAQLVDWSPEMAVPNWVWVRSQRATLKTLTEFANSHKIYIRVRFITWDRALSDLTATWEGADRVNMGGLFSGQASSPVEA